MDILYWLIVGGIAGWLAGKVSKGRGFGLVGNIIIGLVGSVVGGYAFQMLGLAAGGTIGNIVVAFVGGLILVAVVNLIRK
ncbi:MAG: hypothetical protein BWY10_01947 [Chloroflexi bacterium ADurb.Bin180]|nr:MAG: hypothetical protein BWY10_01947 [Chloroflexi bacterium ADurb.Bin180]HOU23262.1 GlsB/YeaQ/YmgE family stress response membrane protein [Anaerolineae bacterium]HQJ51194.1 GlsB/YeaQ/YmgE family stress response membrane protein [Anaerolineae bacterium]